MGNVTIHTLCFIRNAYKERFSRLVNLKGKIRNRLVIFQKNKEHINTLMNILRNVQLVKISNSLRNINSLRGFDTVFKKEIARILLNRIIQKGATVWIL